MMYFTSPSYQKGELNSREIKCLDHDHYSLLVAEPTLEPIYSDSPPRASSKGTIEIKTITEILKRSKKTKGKKRKLTQLHVRHIANIHHRKRSQGLATVTLTQM